MATVPCVPPGSSASASAARSAPFVQPFVTLTKQAHTELLRQANYWKAAHRRALERLERREAQYRGLLGQALQREATLRGELKDAQAKIRDLQQRVFGRKTERSWVVDTLYRQDRSASRSRGQQRGAPGHGRTRLAHLPTRSEIVELDSPKCPNCGLRLSQFPGTEDSEVLELEVKAYRRVIRRRRYRPTCRCGCLTGIVTAPAPARLISKGKLGVSVWVSAMLSKFLYGQPSHRLLHELSDQGLSISPGTLAGGFKQVAPMFVPLQLALVAKLRSESHWHADETRWEVFVERDGKVGHRWYLWVFQSPSAVYYVLDRSRSADVPATALAGVQSGILSVDRYSAYKKFAAQHPGISLSYCWAHQRRDFLKLANDHPDLSGWALGWVDRIGELYRLRTLRRQAQSDQVAYLAREQHLQRAVQAMASQCDDALGCAALATPAAKVLQSMKNHWSGLTLFVEQPCLPMDNNAAERALRPAVVGRKNFYGSGSQWSGQLAATMFSLLMTIKLYQLNPRTWLSAYLNACAGNGNRAPADINAFLPWAMDAARLAAMRACPPRACTLTEGFDTS